MAYYGNILEEELKNKVAYDLFSGFDTTQIIGRIDFCVSIPPDPLGLNEAESLLWAEAKKGTHHDIYESFIQLILTLGKERPQDTFLPPAFLGAFDAEKIAFLPYSVILDVLRQNDFNWNVAPSDHTTKEFLQLKELLSATLHNELEIYNYEADAKELVYFIRRNFTLRKQGIRHIRINKNNFTHIYLKWLDAVKPSININWEKAKQAGIIDADFYLADILSKENNTLSDKLFVLLQDDHYLLDRRINDFGLEDFTKAQFNDNQQAHTQFWNRYARPPRREYWKDIVNRRDLLVPQDVRERKGSFFTPARWVELSQQYIAAELGENWQEEYYVWDCCAGTGNLLAGLTNKYNIFASTLDKADVQAMLQRIDAMNAAARDKQKGGANLLENHVFQFDFLNDPLLDETDKDGNVTKKSKLPKLLQDIIRDPEKRKKLVVYINPPYAEASNARTVTGSGQNRTGLSKTSVQDRYKSKLGRAGNELFAQFFARVVEELPTTVLAQFSKLKIVQAPNFREFRKTFRAKPGRFFLVPANTFDNVNGNFPIAFQIWQTGTEEYFQEIEADVYDAKGEYLGKKSIHSYDNDYFIIEWLRNYYDKTGEHYAYIRYLGTDFQNNNGVFITLHPSVNDLKQVKGTWITPKNVIPTCIYFSVRLCIEATWLNDRDQFLYPNEGWEKDMEFQTNCLVYALFHGQNRISCEHGVNHWIPFTEAEVNAQEKFESHFMSDYLRGKHIPSKVPSCAEGELFADRQTPTNTPEPQKLQFSPEAQAVMDAGRELWSYYHQQPIAKERPNASFYDIRLYFQGTKTTKSGKVQMNTESKDATYTSLITNLRQKQKELAKIIEPKVYEYGFLKK
ncbi:MAG: hypothetical protein SPK85_08010 [Prevotella sp.]|nr:hypothetical protein [Prevotella sp.]